jgi:hypothetical protein
LILIGRLEAEQFGTSSCSLSHSTIISPIALESLESKTYMRLTASVVPHDTNEAAKEVTLLFHYANPSELPSAHHRCAYPFALPFSPRMRLPLPG